MKQMRIRNIIIPACIFILFAGVYIFIAVFMPPDRVVYCPNHDCHGHNTEIIETPPESHPLPNENWSYFKCLDCRTVSAADFKVDNLLTQPVWDIKHYQSIAERGYEKHACDPNKHWPIGDICGNVGWFPAWPGVVKLLSLNNTRIGMMLLPFLITFFGIIVFYNVILKLAKESIAILSTLALVSAPTAFYLLTGFPYAFILLCFSGYLYFLYSEKPKGRPLILPALAIIISLSYPTGFLTAIIPLVMLINNYRRRLMMPGIGEISQDFLFYILPFAVGPLALSLYYLFAFDDFFLFTHFQDKYDRNWGIPFIVMWKSLLQTPTWDTGLFMPPRLAYEKLALVYYGLIFVIFPPYRIKPELLAYGILFYLFSPATGNIVSVYRHYIILFPLAMIIGASPRPLWLKIIFIAAGLFLSLYYFYPFFLNGYLV
ncbi:MAG: hypothetical protein KAR42_08195 [candidate division Zixibacteria bacterium]|nr:hypothetical protein [candidate division Zixibacteria bacterium]